MTNDPLKVPLQTDPVATTDAYVGVQESVLSTLPGHNWVHFLVENTDDTNTIAAIVMGRFVYPDGHRPWSSAWQEVGSRQVIGPEAVANLQAGPRLAYDEYAIFVKSFLAGTPGAAFVYGTAKTITAASSTAAPDNQGAKRSIALPFVAQSGAGRPTAAFVGPSAVYNFVVNDVIYLHVILPTTTDVDEDITLHIDWSPIIAEVGKTSSWQLEYLIMGDDPTAIGTVDGTLQAIDEAVAPIAWQNTQMEFTIPAADIQEGDHEIHLKLTRIASTADPTTVSIHHAHIVVS